jgi:hypothetical protein
MWQQSKVTQVEHNLTTIQETVILQLQQYGQMYFMIYTLILIHPGLRLKPSVYSTQTVSVPTKLRAKQKLRGISTTTIAIQKRMAAIDSGY